MKDARRSAWQALRACRCFARSFVQARECAGITLEQVAVAGKIEDAASVRMSQYQWGTPRGSTLRRTWLAKALDVPVGYFYSPYDQTAELLLLWHSLSKVKRKPVA